MEILKPYSWRLAEEILIGDSDYKKEYDEVINVIKQISSLDIEKAYERDIDEELTKLIKKGKKDPAPASKGLSRTLNKILKEKLIAKNWDSETFIFKHKRYKKKQKNKSGPWQIDFTKELISLEVAFNHQNDIPLNLVKPMLACEDNHVEKEKNTKIVVIVCASQNLKDAGNFDGGAGNFQKIKDYAKPYSQILISPMVIIGLQAPDDFFIPIGKNIKTKINHITRVGDKVYVHKTKKNAATPTEKGNAEASIGIVKEIVYTDEDKMNISIEINGKVEDYDTTGYFSCADR